MNLAILIGYQTSELFMSCFLSCGVLWRPAEAKGWALRLQIHQQPLYFMSSNLTFSIKENEMKFKKSDLWGPILKTKKPGRNLL